MGSRYFSSSVSQTELINVAVKDLFEGDIPTLNLPLSASNNFYYLQ